MIGVTLKERLRLRLEDARDSANGDVRFFVIGYVAGLVVVWYLARR